MKRLTPNAKFWLPLAVIASASSLVLGAQAQQHAALLNGFDKSEWERNRPQGLSKVIEAKLRGRNRSDVTALLGSPDEQHEAGVGMWGPYDAFSNYILDHPRDAHGERQTGYTWYALQVSFSPAGQVTKVEVVGHAY